MDAVGVLVFIHVNVLKTLLPRFAHRGIFAEQADAPEEQVVEIKRVALAQELFVSRENAGDVARILGDGLRAKHFGSLRVVLGVTDAAKDVTRRKGIVVDAEAAHRKLYGSELIVIVVDGEVSRQAGRRVLAAEKAHAEGMKCGNPGLRRRDTGAKKKIRDSSAHFFRGLVGEGHGENALGRHALRDQIGHPKGDGARFAGTCASQKQERAFRGLGSLALLGIEFGKKVEHERRSRGNGHRLC